MKPLGLVVTLAGYTLAYFGYCALRGPGVGLLDLIVPGRTVVIFNAANAADPTSTKPLGLGTSSTALRGPAAPKSGPVPVSSPPGAIRDPYSSFPGGVGGLGSFGG